jgi:hypothetical protein
LLQEQRERKARIKKDNTVKAAESLLLSLTTKAEGYSEDISLNNLIASDFVLKSPTVTLKNGLSWFQYALTELYLLKKPIHNLLGP